MNRLINLISDIINKKLRMKLIINFDGSGGFKYNAEISQDGVDALIK